MLYSWRCQSEGPMKVFSYGSFDVGLSQSDFISIFHTPHVHLQKCSMSSQRQAIKFPMITNSPVIGSTVIHNSYQREQE